MVNFAPGAILFCSVTIDVIQLNHMARYDLITLYSEPGVNQISGFCDVANSLDVTGLVHAYDDLVNQSPRRKIHHRDYFISGHDGLPSGNENSNRREEHLALALFNHSQEFELPDGRLLRFIDYQTPLKAKQTDKGIGKVDLFGVLDQTTPAVIELKIQRKNGGKADTPLRALLEGLAYCAMIEANHGDIAIEARSTFNLDFSQPRPDLIVMAPQDYWHDYLGKPSAGDWLVVLEALIDELKQKLNLNVHLISLQDAAFEMGSAQQRPQLKGDCRLASVG